MYIIPFNRDEMNLYDHLLSAGFIAYAFVPGEWLG